MASEIAHPGPLPYNGPVPALLLLALVASAPGPDLVDVSAVIPDAVLDLRYATPRNIAGRPLYPVARCLLLRPVADRLAAAAARLRQQGYRLVLWDCYRPASAHAELFRSHPHPGSVADPARGSHHSRGAAVDLSLARRDGSPVDMPTDFDAFGARAAAEATAGVAEAARRHRDALRGAMEAAGFAGNPREWWHYAWRGAARLPVLDEPLR